MCVCLSVFLCVFACLCMCLSVCLCVCVSVCMCFCASVYLCQYVCVSICLCVCVSVRLCGCLLCCDLNKKLKIYYFLHTGHVSFIMRSCPGPFFTMRARSNTRTITHTCARACTKRTNLEKIQQLQATFPLYCDHAHVLFSQCAHAQTPERTLTHAHALARNDTSQQKQKQQQQKYPHKRSCHIGAYFTLDTSTYILHYLAPLHLYYLAPQV
jgi:hypothetical protein